ncbi:MAG: hypothetical protein D8M59_03440 [Planctomycetes bacterium]|nr:hypothetical protein [Planctomycetota bacterium]NOG53050.1 hypothetical protein [Planctomycetota bacterium]
MSVRRLTFCSLTAWPVMFGVVMTAAADDPVIHRDSQGDAVFRRTDFLADGDLNPLTIAPDIREVRYGFWNTNTPLTDPYKGRWTEDDDAGIWRLDLLFDGLVQPPGPIGLSGPTYDPFQYGPSPVYGYLELDLDDELETGGEVENVANRYMGNVARFGSRPRGVLGQSIAFIGSDLDGELLTPPYVERSGEEVHFSLCGCQDYQVTQTFGDPSPDTFDEGDVWLLEGRFLHRSHVFTPYSFAFGGSSSGEYDPLIELRIEHDFQSDVTMLSIVCAATPEGAALLTGEPQQALDLDASNHVSLLEFLFDMQFTAQFGSDPGPGTSFDLVRAWADGDHDDLYDFFEVEDWEVNALFGTAYLEQDPIAHYVWTDVGFGLQFGDVTGDGEVTKADQNAIMNAVRHADGRGPDTDRLANGQVVLDAFGLNFALYDLTYTGAVNAIDLEAIGYDKPGDINLDRQVTYADLRMADDMRGSIAGDVIFNPAADMDNNGIISKADLQIIYQIIKDN